MHYKRNNFLALIVSIAIIICAFFVFADEILKSSLAPGLEELSSNQLDKDAKVYRNKFGIPHIVAESEKDMFFMVGYCQAQDRLWQMDYLRRAYRGELSEILGKDALLYDKFIRSIGLNRIARNNLRNLDQNTKKILESFSNGVNFFIEKHKKSLPLEFSTLEYFPEQWKPIDCLLISKGMAFQMSVSFWGDIMFGEIADKIGIDRTIQLVPNNYASNNELCIFANQVIQTKVDSTKKDSLTKKTTAVKSANATTGNTKELKKSLAVLNGINQITALTQKYLNWTPSSFGSNSWAIIKNKLKHKGTILANDIHLPLTNPSIWYQLHYTCPSMNVTGVAITGTPLIISGRSDDISWGITSSMLDDFDYFIDKLDSSNNSRYLTSNGTYKDFKNVLDTIKVKKSNDYIYYLRKTDRSAVISDSYLGNSESLKHRKFFTNPKSSNYFTKYCLTFLWSGSEISNEFKALYNINKAKTWNQFASYVSDFRSPSLIFTFADKRNNIGAIASGLIPNRGDSSNSNSNIKPYLPNPGWLGINWHGYTNAASVYNILNPQEAFVIAANNKLTYYKGQYFTSYWEHASRATRIKELLSDDNSYSYRDAEIMQMDNYSEYAKRIVTKTIPIITAKYSQMNTCQARAFELMKNWDYIFTVYSPAASIFDVFMQKLKFNAFYEKLGYGFLNNYETIANLSTRKIEEMFNDSSSVWTVNKNSYINGKESLIFTSFCQAVDSLRNFFQTDNVYQWYYAKIHQLCINHVLSKIALLQPVLTLGPEAIGGTNTSINCIDFANNSQNDTKIGVSLRLISDMETNYMWTILPGGSSADPFSHNYSNQFLLWLNGGYIKLNTSRDPDDDFTLCTAVTAK